MSFYSIVKLLSFSVHTVLGLYALWKNPRRRLNQAFSLTVLSIGVMEFGYFMLLIGSGRTIWMRIALVGQCLVHGNIVLLSLIYGRENYRDSLKSGRLYLIAICCISLVLSIAISFGMLKFELLDSSINRFGVASSTRLSDGLVFSRAGLLFFIFLFTCTLLSLINLENTYRQARQSGRRIIYPAIVFIGMLSFHLLIYSWALGFSYIRMDILIVASITLIAANVCMAFPVIRPEPTGSRIYVGRAVMSKSYTLLLAGIYLLIIGMLGKIIQIIGKNLSFFLAFLVAFFILLVIMSIILSKSLKRRFQLFVERNFYKPRYDYRREWENFSRRVFSILSMRGLVREVLDTVSETIQTDIVFIMLLDEHKGEFFTADPDDSGDVVCSISARDEFLDWLWRRGSPVEIDNGQCKANGTSAGSPRVPDELLSVLNRGAQNAGSGVFVPIIAEHRLIAIMILGQRKSPYSQEDMDLLETMANQISIAIMNAKTSRELAVSRQLESFHKLSAMLLHDLKSSASMLSLVIQNAAGNFDNPEFQKDALSAMSSVVDRIQKLILKFSAAPQETDFHPAFQLVDPNEIVGGAVAKSGVRDVAKIEVLEKYGSLPEIMVDPENLERVIMNLILNAIEAIEDKGTITISTCEEGTQDLYAIVSVSDTGCGMSQEFIRDRLFQPFQTSKKSGLGIGLYQCKAIIDACGGVINVQSRQGGGSTFAVKLPIRNMRRNAHDEKHRSVSITGDKGREN